MGDGSDDTAGLSQADFRRLLATPSTTAGDKSANAKRSALGAGLLFRPPRVKNSAREGDKNRSKHGVKQHLKQQQSQYRDRAAERRQGVSSEYEEGERMLQQLRDSTTEEDSRQREYEQSKYLGGDIEHTHLVKGLDFLLLEKERARGGGEELDDELERLQTEGAHADSTCAAASEGFDAATATTPLGQRMMAALKRIHDAREEACRSIEDGFRADLNELFLPGRMYFEFASATPTTRIRNQDEVRMRSSTGTADLADPGGDADVLRKVVASIAETWGKRSQPKSQEALPGDCRESSGEALQQTAAGNPAPPGTDSDDEDIFADAGTDYEVTVAKGSPGDDIAPGPALPPNEGEPVVGPYPNSDGGMEDSVVGPYPGSNSEMEDCAVGPYPGSNSEMDDNAVGLYPAGSSGGDQGAVGPYPGVDWDPDGSSGEESDTELLSQARSRFHQETRDLLDQASSPGPDKSFQTKRKAGKSASASQDRKRTRRAIKSKRGVGIGSSKQ